MMFSRLDDEELETKTMLEEEEEEEEEGDLRDSGAQLLEDEDGPNEDYSEFSDIDDDDADDEFDASAEFDEDE